MRVCMLAYAFYENDTRIRQYASALVERGDLVDVIALRREGQSAEDVVDGVHVYRIQTRTINEQGPLAYLYRITRFLLLSSVVLAKKHLRHPYQVVHVHSVPDFLVFAALIPKLFGASVVLDINDVLPELYASKFNLKQNSILFRLLALIEKLSAAFSNHVIIANDIWHRRLVSRSVRGDKCTTIRNYPDPRFFFPRPRNGSNGKFVIMYPGTLNSHQGLDVAIKAFAKIAPAIPHAEFHIYGEGPAKPGLMTLTDRLGLGDRVTFHDFLPNQQIAELMAKSDLGVDPNRASSSFGNEASSTKILEFMAVGVPLVVSRTAIHTYYHDESTLKYFESDDESDLADAILLLKYDSRLRDEMVSNATRHVQINSWKVKKLEYLGLLDSLVARELTQTARSQS